MGSKNIPYLHMLLTFLHIFLLLTTTSLSDSTEMTKLLKFKESLLNTQALSNWNPNVTLCLWTGVLCARDGRTVLGLVLEGWGLAGTIDIDTLAEMQTIGMLSFSNNSFQGPMPDVKKIVTLSAIFLSHNNFSGVIRDDAFAGMSSLRRVVLNNNKFTGQIPVSLTGLNSLFSLQMQDNAFEGQIPEFEQKFFVVNFANNTLSGQIPPGLRNQDPSAFAGNDLCGPPVANPCKIFKKASNSYPSELLQAPQS